ncbi:hypothetical protein E2C01_038567 [Portunus trituberculatus]|uniref:Uncharacterized protein n=1 Tax=Portunus trituberculatus TaxID=210409 RepID=A0A5B7FHJ0_PORTR|nr:hypothetical protein [Portunus trituberculatus]
MAKTRLIIEGFMLSQCKHTTTITTTTTTTTNTSNLATHRPLKAFPPLSPEAPEKDEKGGLAQRKTRINPKRSRRVSA